MSEPPLPRLVIQQGHDQAGSGIMVALTGELDGSTSADLREAVVLLAAQPQIRGRLLLDLSAVTYCDNASLYTLLGICEALDLVGICVALTAVSPAVGTCIHRNALEERLPVGAVLDAISGAANEGSGGTTSTRS
ncbi:STAS domain-containing protein [Streptomyces sp. NPDC051218]|uniref:STAS domain-containing protein n=1 Tax=Streptomyces sp. NPDC051218 TaxID=3365645 RepID=UPI0037BCB4C5